MQAKKKAKRFNPLQKMESYVSRSPQMSDFPMMEEVDSFRRTEKSVLNLWSGQNFTVAGFIILFGLFVYMAVIVGPPPTH